MDVMELDPEPTWKVINVKNKLWYKPSGGRKFEVVGRDLNRFPG